MARGQNSPRGLFVKNAINVGAQGLTANATHLILTGGIKLNAAANGAIVANTTGVTFAGTITAARFQLVDNSTGATVRINTTGTTWKFLNVTSVQPT